MTNKGFIRLLLIYFSTCIFSFSGIQIVHAGSLRLAQKDSIDTQLVDTLPVDSSKQKKPEKHDIDDPVKYSSKDSLYFDLEKKTVHLYGEAKVSYQNIELTAAYIEFDMTNQTVYATGVEDSTGTMKGIPHFKEGGEEFDAHWLRYNFKTKKGFVYFVKTKQTDGTLIGDSTKRNPNGHIHLKGGKYSTCDLDHPHFYLQLTKAKAVPNDKVVSGPAYLVVADIPLPLILPFGYFPNTKGFSSGLLLPTWGQEQARGFNLRKAGYYFAVNDYLDGSLTGDIYSKGSWAAYANTNYKLRYRFTGRVDLSYNNNVTSEKGMPDYSVQKDFRILWNHTQDPKANPTTSFNANVNLSSTSYDKNNSYNSDYLTNTKTSSISYSKRWQNAPFNLSASMNHSQNSLTKDVSMTAPNVSVSMNPVYPFRKEESSGDKWYEDIQFTYNAKFENRIKTKDSLFLTGRMFNEMNNGFSHTIPLSTNFKLTRFINLTPSIAYDGVLYTKQIKYRNNNNGDIDTLIYHGPVYAHSVKPSISLNYTPKLYGMYMFKDSKIKAIRHVMSPTAGISFQPDISDYVPNYYDTYINKSGKKVRYSYFDKNIYGTPTPPPGKAASISFGLRNNLEMKYRSDNDSTSEVKKVAILENLDFSGSYNLMADSFNLSNISMSTGTKLFQDKFNVQLTASFDPYAKDKEGNRLKSYAIDKNGKLAHLQTASLTAGTSFRSGERTGQATGSNSTRTEKGNPANLGLENDFDDDEIRYDIPWSLNVNYGWTYNKQKLTSSIIQTLSFSGDISVTKKWKVGFSSGYDFTNKQISYTRFNLSRDLHCWEMKFDWVPFGAHTNYNFTINARGILQDLKYNKRKDWRDY